MFLMAILKLLVQKTATIAGVAIFVGMLLVQEVMAELYPPASTAGYPNNVYWGDMHLHTNLSSDGFVSSTYGINPVGRLDANDAYALAKGKTIVATNGMKVSLSRPLDFLAITDHAEALGLVYSLAINDPILQLSEQGKKWRKALVDIESTSLPAQAAARMWSLLSDIKSSQSGGDLDDLVFRRSIWSAVIENAERHNEPGKFSAFIGYEWTGMILRGKGRGWWHRNVIFKDGSKRVETVLPYSQLDSNKPEDLWSYLSSYESSTGGEAIAIPHNPNLSGGKLFQLNDSDGKPFDRSYAEKRSIYEPLVEVTQTKGDSETHPLLSPNDEFADYERWSWFGDSDKAKSERKFDYVRSALKLGLNEQARIGVNPFQFGLIGSTDSHNSLSNVEESSFGGKLLDLEPSKGRLVKAEGWFKKVYGKQDSFSASGYVAIWSQENTRESLFAAMKRKEVYASTGPRMNIRFFGGWDYQPDDAFKPDLARVGYNKGVPMGSDLSNAPVKQSPTFLIRAVKDPDGANLDRVQVIKGWRTEGSELKEKVYDVALSDDRNINRDGKVRPVGNTVDIVDASYSNTIGDSELAVVWKDPDFDPDELSFYYVRVLEIPTPRWPAYDAKYFGLKDLPKEILMVTQERAYTSPIWYSPPAKAGGE